MNNKTDDVVEKEMTGHNYDGITECDNPLPGWWLWTFLFTIIFGFIYLVHYSSGAGPTLKQELDLAMQEIDKTKSQVTVASETEAELEKSMGVAGIDAVGAATYSSKCAVCHGPELQGLIGPNLTDKNWLHGKGTRVAIVKVVREGVLDKGMPNWDQILTKDEIYAVTALIISKKGSLPKNPKAPQGELVE